MPTPAETAILARDEAKKRVLASYRAIVGSQDWPLVHLDLLQFAHDAKDAQVACGIYECVGRIVRLAQTPGTLVMEEANGQHVR